MKSPRDLAERVLRCLKGKDRKCKNRTVSDVRHGMGTESSHHTNALDWHVCHARSRNGLLPHVDSEYDRTRVSTARAAVYATDVIAKIIARRKLRIVTRVAIDTGFAQLR